LETFGEKSAQIVAKDGSVEEERITVKFGQQDNSVSAHE